MKRAPLAIVALLCVAAAPVASTSLEFPPGSTVLGTVAKRGEIRLAVPDDAPPFAWTARDGQPIGYAVDACRQVAGDVAAALGQPLAEEGAQAGRNALALRFVSVPAAEEAAAVGDGSVDLGCSAVPPTPSAGTAPSPPLAVSGVRLLAAREGPVSSIRDLPGRTVAVIDGSEAARIMAVIAGTLSPPARVVAVPGPGDAYERVATGAADAFAADDLLLAGLLATRTDGPSLRVVGRELTHEPLALLFRGRDPAFAALVRQSFARMRADGTLRAGYMRWFTEPLPDGAALDRPPSRETDELLGS